MQEALEPPFYRSQLITEFRARLTRNPSYSIRAYAKSLNISAGALSQIINGKRPISLKSAVRIIPKLSLNAEESKQFIHSILKEKSERVKKGSNEVQKTRARMLVHADPERIPEAQEKIQAFLKEITEFLEGGSPKGVYEIAVQISPLPQAEQLSTSEKSN